MPKEKKEEPTPVDLQHQKNIDISDLLLEELFEEYEFLQDYQEVNKFLWKDESLYRFRVNFFDDYGLIKYSYFVHIDFSNPKRGKIAKVDPPIGVTVTK